MYIVRTASLFVLILALLASAAPQAGAQQETSQPPPPTNRVQSPPVGPIQGPDGLWMMPAGADRAAEGMELAPQSTGGPDEFGYTWDDSVPLNWIDASGGIETGITSTVDHVGPINIGFPFKYYENTRSQIYISRFGFLAFNDDGIYNSQSSVPSTEKPDDVIAPLGCRWTASTATCAICAAASAPNRWFVVEWNRLVSDYLRRSAGRIPSRQSYVRAEISSSNTVQCPLAAVAGARHLESKMLPALMALRSRRSVRTFENNHAVQICDRRRRRELGYRRCFRANSPRPARRASFRYRSATPATLSRHVRSDGLIALARYRSFPQTA
ncbi:MAG: hypothetical protein H6647_07660 [Anaerolineales bacterium]|nr:hypothetical protein [Anaerolineales bacterium]